MVPREDRTSAKAQAQEQKTWILEAEVPDELGYVFCDFMASKSEELSKASDLPYFGELPFGSPDCLTEIWGTLRAAWVRLQNAKDNFALWIPPNSPQTRTPEKMIRLKREIEDERSKCCVRHWKAARPRLEG